MLNTKGFQFLLILQIKKKRFYWSFYLDVFFKSVNVSKTYFISNFARAYDDN